MKKIFLLLFLISFPLLIGSNAFASNTKCNWTKSVSKTTNFGGGSAGATMTTVEVCPDDMLAGNTCTGTAEAGQLCCCIEDIVVNDKPRYILPDFTWQVKIPGMANLSTVECVDKCEIPWISEYVFGVYDYLLSIAGVLAVVILMAAGLLWIVSGGDAGRIGQAKKMITGSVVGLMLLVSMNLLLTYINPALKQKTYLSLDVIQRKSLEDLAIGRNNQSAKYYQNSGCATDDQLKNGVIFYATGYYKPAYNANDPNFWCVIAMQCSCPNGRDTTKNCDHLYGKSFPGYAPCKPFDANTPYCNLTASGIPPEIGDIAGPNCSNLPPFTKVCFKGKTYRITDKGGGIQGKRIDIWSGNDLEAAKAHTGSGTLTIGECK